MPLLDMNTDPWTSVPAMSTPAAAYGHAAQHHHHHNHHSHGHQPVWGPPHVDSGPKTYSATDMPPFRPSSERHSQVAGGDAATASPRPMPSGAWRLPHGDHSQAPPSLQVHIPQAPLQDVPRPASTSTAGHAQDARSFTHHEHPPPAQYPSSGGSTSLPSFASFQEHTARNEEGDLIIAPMSQRISCNMCTKLKPLVREIAAAVGDVDENVQSLCAKSITRPSEFPSDSAVRTAHWILDRLRCARGDLQDAGRRAQSGGPAAFASQNLSPPHPLKRNADSWERDDLPKRPRSGASTDQPFHMSSAMTPRDERRTSMDYGSRDMYPRSAYSPPPDSLPGSAHPKQGSPIMTGRGMRALPSPSSMAYPLSAAPSLPAGAQSVGSPAPSYQPMHTMSASSATSAHMADLQHQVSLKSLALQTLQGEYASLLQKLQREKVKSQTIEKKTSVADQEVNELTSKNEELTDQVRILEQQLEDSEKKRETDRAEAAKEKDQWGRMLEMGGRLHAKGVEDRQKLAEEKTYLLERIALLERQDSTQRGLLLARQDSGADRPKSRLSHNHTSGIGPSAMMTTTTTTTTTSSSEGGSNAEHAGLKGEVVVLNARIDSLRLALEEARRHNQDLEVKASAIAQHTGLVNATIDRALRDEDAKAKTQPSEQSQAVPQASQRAQPSQDSTSMLPPHSSRGSTASSHTAHSLERGSVPSAPTGSSAISPSSADIGYDTSASSEEIIKSLAPVPAPPSKTAPESHRSRSGDAVMHEQAHGQSEYGAWTHSEHGLYWNAHDRPTQVMPVVRQQLPAIRSFQYVDSPYRGESSPRSSGSPSSDVTDETSVGSAAAVQRQTSLDCCASDAEYSRHADAKPFTMSALAQYRHEAYATHHQASRDVSYMLPPPRPA